MKKQQILVIFLLSISIVLAEFEDFQKRPNILEECLKSCKLSDEPRECLDNCIQESIEKTNKDLYSYGNNTKGNNRRLEERKMSENSEEFDKLLEDDETSESELLFKCEPIVDNILQKCVEEKGNTNCTMEEIELKQCKKLACEIAEYANAKFIDCD